MAQDHSFDIVSKVNLQEVRNAVQQGQKELVTRFDFRGSRASLEFDEAAGLFKMSGDHQGQLGAVRDLLHAKLAKRGVPLRALAWKSPETLPSGAMKQEAHLQQGIPADKARDLVAAVKTLGLKVQARIEGDAVRVTGRQRDDLQAVIQRLHGADFGLPLQFENYR